MPDLALDIEVVGPSWSELDEPTRDYLARRWRNKPDLLDEDEAGYLSEPESEPGDGVHAKLSQRAALELGLAQVVAVGMWLPEQQRGYCGVLAPGGLLMGEGLAGFATESELLADAWVRIGRHRLVTFNGRTFDGPVLMIRSAELGVVVARNLVPYRYDLSEHCDLMDVLGFQGATRNAYGLDYWCRRFGIEGKGDVSGKDVARLWAEQRAQEIGQYCLDDARRTAELYARLRDSGLLAQFKGGPVQHDAAPPWDED